MAVTGVTSNAAIWVSPGASNIQSPANIFWSSGSDLLSLPLVLSATPLACHDDHYPGSASSSQCALSTGVSMTLAVDGHEGIRRHHVAPCPPRTSASSYAEAPHSFLSSPALSSVKGSKGSWSGQTPISALLRSICVTPRAAHSHWQTVPQSYKISLLCLLSEDQPSVVTFTISIFASSKVTDLQKVPKYPRHVCEYVFSMICCILLCSPSHHKQTIKAVHNCFSNACITMATRQKVLLLLNGMSSCWPSVNKKANSKH